MPYVWPKGAAALQGLVLLCLGLLLAERLVNVLVPVYSKNIGKTAKSTEADPDHSCLTGCDG